MIRQTIRRTGLRERLAMDPLQRRRLHLRGTVSRLQTNLSATRIQGTGGPLGEVRVRGLASRHRARRLARTFRPGPLHRRLCARGFGQAPAVHEARRACARAGWPPTPPSSSTAACPGLLAGVTTSPGHSTRSPTWSSHFPARSSCRGAAKWESWAISQVAAYFPHHGHSTRSRGELRFSFPHRGSATW